MAVSGWCDAMCDQGAERFVTGPNHFTDSSFHNLYLFVSLFVRLHQQYLDSMVQVFEASRDTEVESRTTIIGKRRHSCTGVLCAARQRHVTKFAAIARRHSLIIASCYWHLYKVYDDAFLWFRKSVNLEKNKGIVMLWHS